MKEIPLIAWIIIGVIGLIVLSSYLSLFSMLHNKNKKPGQFSWINSWRALSRPYEKEDKQLTELSDQVSRYKAENPADDRSSDRPDQPFS